MRRTRLVVAVAIPCLPVAAFLASPVLAQEPEDQAQTAFRRDLERILDRWNDDAPPNRLARAKEICERRVKEAPNDAEARLELIRFRLAHAELELASAETHRYRIALGEEPDRKRAEAAFRAATAELEAAAKEALRAEGEATGAPDRILQARALYFLSFLAGASANERVFDDKREEREKRAAEFQKRVLEVNQKLVDAATAVVSAQEKKEKAEAVASRVLAAERERIATATALDRLGKPPAKIDKKDTEGNLVSLESYVGKVVVVDFWATFAAEYLEKELAATLAVHEAWKARGVEVVGFSLDNDRAAVDAVVKERKIPWRQVFTGKGFADDVARAWGVSVVPRRFLLDHQGKVRYVDVRGDALAAAVKSLVERAERAVGPPK